MKIFIATYSEDEIYSNVELITTTENERLGVFTSLAKAERKIDSHYRKRFPGYEYDNYRGAAKPGEILKKKNKTKGGYTYNGGLVYYRITEETIK